MVLAPRSLVTGKEFAHETGLFRDEYGIFMRDGMITYILQRNPELSSAYETAAPLAGQAFAKFERLSGFFERVRDLSPAEGKDLYMTVQESKDESLYGIFGEIRDSSFYLNNIFESFLNRFVRGIRLQAESLERATADDLPHKAIVRKWWDYMGDIMETNPDHSPASKPLSPVFHMD